MKPVYVGIGSRNTPIHVQQLMAQIAEELSDKWILRSGHADGADKAFESGCKGEKEIYLPWAGFNGSRDRSHIVMPPGEAAKIASKFHPAWGRLSDVVKLLHTRNVFQILGADLSSPAHMVICWTQDGKGSGGTGQAIRIAQSASIPVFDLAIENIHLPLIEHVKTIEKLLEKE